MSLRRFLCLAALLLSAAAHADAPGVYAITGGTVHPVSGPEIADGVVIIRDGLIESVGANVAIPPDATTIDVKGGHVYPGLIDAQTSLGFPSPTPRRRGGPGQQAQRSAQQPPTLPETSPAFLGSRETKLSDDDVEAKRATGVTTILAAPSFGILNGQSVLLNLGEGELGSRRGVVVTERSTNSFASLPFRGAVFGFGSDDDATRATKTIKAAGSPRRH